MDQTLIDLAVFLLGAGSGAALSYLKDRRLLHQYSDLVRQLSGALQQQVEELQGQVAHALVVEAEAQTRWWREQAQAFRETSVS